MAAIDAATTANVPQSFRPARTTRPSGARATIGAKRSSPRRSPQISSPSLAQSGRFRPSGLVAEWTSAKRRVTRKK